MSLRCPSDTEIRGNDGHKKYDGHQPYAHSISMRDLNVPNPVSSINKSAIESSEASLANKPGRGVEKGHGEARSLLEKHQLPPATFVKELQLVSAATDIPLSVSRESMLGYHYLCGERRESQDSQSVHGGLSLLRLQLEEGCFADKDTIPSDDIREVLERNGIDVAMWNHIVEATDSAALSAAIGRARALALGFDEDTPNSVIDAEAAIVEERFAEREFERIMEALDRIRKSPELHEGRVDDQGVIKLHEIVLKSNRDIPPEGFREYQLTGQDFLDFPSTFWAKLSARFPLLSGGSEEEQADRVNEAAKRTWLSPVAESILSPSIQELFKRLQENKISYECSTKRDDKGFLLNFRFFIDPKNIPDITGGHRLKTSAPLKLNAESL